jgi:hypothetical protein
MDITEVSELPYDVLQIIYSYLDIDTRILFRKIYNNKCNNKCNNPYIFKENKLDPSRYINLEKPYYEEISENKHVMSVGKYTITKQLCDKCKDFEYSTLLQKDDKHIWLGKICICSTKSSNNNNFNLNLDSDCTIS